MKNGNWLLYIAIIVVTGILIGFTSYTTGTSSKKRDTGKTFQTDPVTTNGTANSDAVKKKSCGCCAKRKAVQQERIKQARARKLARKSVPKTSSNMHPFNQ